MRVSSLVERVRPRFALAPSHDHQGEHDLELEILQVGTEVSFISHRNGKED